MSDLKQPYDQRKLAKPSGARAHKTKFQAKLDEAADHIAALEARNARLEEQVREAYERCAKVCEDFANERNDDGVLIWKGHVISGAEQCAERIRSLTTEQTNG